VDVVVIGTPIDLRRVIDIRKPAVRVRYDLEVMHADRVAATGIVVTVFLPEGAEHAQPWPDQVRERLREGGDRTAG